MTEVKISQASTWPQDADVSEAYREAFNLNPDNAAANLAALAEALRCRHRVALQATPPAQAKDAPALEAPSVPGSDLALVLAALEHGHPRSRHTEVLAAARRLAAAPQAPAVPAVDAPAAANNPEFPEGCAAPAQAVAVPIDNNLLGEIIGCFDAALDEGLMEALLNTQDAHLADLVTRRLMHAYYAAIGPSISAPAQEHATQLAGQGRRFYAEEIDSRARVLEVNGSGMGLDAALAFTDSRHEAELIADALHAYLAAPAQAQEDARDALTQAARDVLAERARQVSAEGWAPERDDKYDDGAMSDAGAAYALLAFNPDGKRTKKPNFWPWSEQWWKPSEPRRNLEKAGALILAEMERLDRAAARAAQGGA